jgi:hypothetical protein
MQNENLATVYSGGAAKRELLWLDNADPIDEDG